MDLEYRRSLAMLTTVKDKSEKEEGQRKFSRRKVGDVFGRGIVYRSARWVCKLQTRLLDHLLSVRAWLYLGTAAIVIGVLFSVIVICFFGMFCRVRYDIKSA